MRNTHYDARIKGIATFGNGIPAKVIGWFFVIASISFIPSIIDVLDWNLKKDNYVERYAYNENGRFYYEFDGRRTYIDKIYNTDGEITEPKVPNDKFVVMYCLKTNDRECIYFNLVSNNGGGDEYALNPFGLIFGMLFCLTLGPCLITVAKSSDKPTSTPAILASYLFFIVGLIGFVYSLYLTYDYFKVKSQNNLVEGISYSELYINNYKKYRPVVYYYVDGKKYIHVCQFKDGDFDNNKNLKIELYYDSLDPNKVVEKDNSRNIAMIFIGLFLMAFGFPGVFMKKWLDKKIENDRVLLSKEIEWKI